jgi:hypothetical protein
VVNRRLAGLRSLFVFVQLTTAVLAWLFWRASAQPGADETGSALATLSVQTNGKRWSLRQEKHYDESEQHRDGRL